MTPARPAASFLCHGSVDPATAKAGLYLGDALSVLSPGIDLPAATAKRRRDIS
jgi:hypothetical protein